MNSAPGHEQSCTLVVWEYEWMGVAKVVGVVNGGVVIVSIHLSSILHQNNRPNTSKRWLLTLFPFLFHTILGRGSPVAWQMKEATPPWTPVWSFGVLKNFGGAEREKAGRDVVTQLIQADYWTEVGVCVHCALGARQHRLYNTAVNENKKMQSNEQRKDVKIIPWTQKAADVAEIRGSC